METEHGTFAHLLIPDGEATPDAAPLELTAAAALAELRDALAGWIDDALERADGYVHDSDRANVPQIRNSLFNAADILTYASDRDDDRDTERVGRHLRYAAEQVESGYRVVTSLAAGFPHPAVELNRVDTLVSWASTHFASAVAYVRQAHDFLEHRRHTPDAKAL